MGITKQYLRFVPSSVFNIVTNADCNAIVVQCGRNGRSSIATGACENILVWDIRTSSKVKTIFSENAGSSVTVLLELEPGVVAAGYSDGMVSIFDLNSCEQKVSFQGHRSGVTALTYEAGTMTLISGSKDTHLILWDVVAECGKVKLKGHTGPITQTRMMRTRRVLVSSSKDTLIKLWDLDSHHCFMTIAGHQSEVWDFCFLRGESWLVSGSSDPILRVWDISSEAEPREIGSLLRSTQGSRITGLAVPPGSQFLVAHGSTREADVFWVTTEAEKAKRKAKRLKKNKEEPSSAQTSLQDDILRLPNLVVPLKRKKFKSFCFFPSGLRGRGHDPVPEDSEEEVDVRGARKEVGNESQGKDQLDFYALFSDNTMGRMRLDSKRRAGSSQPVVSSPLLPFPGHPSDVRTVGFSSDGLGLFSGSKESLRVWSSLYHNEEEEAEGRVACVRTLPATEALCGVFAPGDRHILLGGRNGTITIYDVGRAEMLEEVTGAHGAQAVWAMALLPSQEGIVTCGSDKTVKFWEFSILQTKEAKGNVGILSILHTRTLELDEEALAVRISSNQKHLAVALLDSTVKIFYVDTFKFFLSLYGHSLPVTCLDISSDTTLIATGAGDKNVKIWGMDFGDCHKSIFAHDDGILALQFLPRTHMFFTSGKDGKIKQWDADNFQRILTLSGHLGPVWSIAVSPDGRVVASASADRSIRLWRRSQEILVLDDERETERDKEDETLATGGGGVIPGESNTEVALPGKRTLNAELGAEKLMEALEIVANAGQNEKEGDALGLLTGGLAPLEFLLEVLRKIRSSDLEETLLVLPFRPYVEDLISALAQLLRRGQQVELLVRVLNFLVRCHHSVMLSASESILPQLRLLRDEAKERAAELKDVVGTNLAALSCVQSHLESQSGASLFREQARAGRKKRKKKSKALVRSSQVAVLHV